MLVYQRVSEAKTGSKSRPQIWFLPQNLVPKSELPNWGNPPVKNTNQTNFLGIPRINETKHSQDIFQDREDFHHRGSRCGCFLHRHPMWNEYQGPNVPNWGLLMIVDDWVFTWNSPYCQPQNVHIHRRIISRNIHGSPLPAQLQSHHELHGSWPVKCFSQHVLYINLTQ